MTKIVEFNTVTDWAQPASAEQQTAALQALEHGDVLLFPRLKFALDDSEAKAIVAPLDTSAKNISYDAASGRLRGLEAAPGQQQVLQGMVARFNQQTRALLHALMPRYDAGLQQGRTSFRPAEIEGRSTSWRKDDTRLHVDSFPSTPTQGRRILRVFSNINPHGQARVWNVGEPFETVARRFVPQAPRPLPGSAALMQALHITKTRRTAYDHYMLQLHDRMKADLQYQAGVAKTQQLFQPDTSWMVYTDQASHAALRGQYALEQTYYVQPQVLLEPGHAPLAVLERIVGHALV